MSIDRKTPAEQLPGATRFSDDRARGSALQLIRDLKTQPQFLDVVKRAAIKSNWGRERMDGCWPLAYIAYVASGKMDVEPWWRETTVTLWHECDFAARPSYQTTYLRFCELESQIDHFERAANLLVRRAGFHTQGRVGRVLVVDGTESDTHAGLIHDCEKGKCPRAGRRVAKRPDLLGSADARDGRHAAARQAPEDDTSAADDAVGDVYALSGRLAKHVKIGGCRYRILDRDAGVRAYTLNGKTRRFWAGYYSTPAIDLFTGAPVAVHVSSASLNEHQTYELLYKQAVAATGRTPDAVVADRGYSINAVFEFNTRRGVASIIPWRKSKTEPKRLDRDAYDRHGIPRCRQCGGETRFIRFDTGGSNPDAAKPRLWFRCQVPTPKCKKDQSISCSTNWRFLLPLWRNTELYLSLRDQQKNLERVHRHSRDRHNVAGNAVANRPKRFGIHCQQLRATVNVFITWFRICWREGWLGTVRAKLRATARLDGSSKLASFFDRRHAEGLDRPYGKKAIKLGLIKPPPDDPAFGAPPGTDDDLPF